MSFLICKILYNNLLIFLIIAIIINVIFLLILANLKPKTNLHELKEIKKEVIKEVEVPKKEIKEEELIGSPEQKKFHKKSCRYAKNIKDKEKGTKEYFRKKGYKACKVCKP